MRLAVTTFKECWQDEHGKWFSDGGFPGQMKAIASLFDDTTLLVVGVKPREGGIPLPEKAHVVPLKPLAGKDTRRKLFLFSRLPYYLGNILQIVRRADVVHAPLPGDIPLLGMLVAVFSGKRLIGRYAGSWEKTAHTTLMNRFTRACMRRFAGDKRVMFATGSGDQSPAPGIDWLFTTALSQDEIDRIHPVLDRSLSSPPVVVFAGRLSIEKGLVYLIEAVGRLKKEGFHPLPEIRLIGAGPERTHLEALTLEWHCQNLVTFTGQLNRLALSKEMMGADFCVQPSLTEGFSKAWLDAMVHGLPVLTTEVGAAQKVIGRQGERGWLVPPGDAGALCNTLQEILSNSRDWPALRRRCREYVTGLTLEAWAEAIGSACARQWGIRLVEGKLRE